jgi:MinD-like ATPase involved in chromosome partitioning or flagellar assembly
MEVAKVARVLRPFNVVDKTTTTLILGHTFASHRGDRVIAIDATPTSTHYHDVANCASASARLP